MTLIEDTELNFQIKPMMQKAGIIKLTLKRLDFVIEFSQVKANGETQEYIEFAEFKPTLSFADNRDNIMRVLNKLFKGNSLSSDFGEGEDLTKLHIEITSNIADNSEALSQIMGDNPYEPEERKPKEIFTYKYAGNGTLYETIVLEGKPYFVYYNPDASEPNEQIKLSLGLTEDDRIIRPILKYMHVSKPYEFDSEED